jgi:hypothetical protein
VDETGDDVLDVARRGSPAKGALLEGVVRVDLRLETREAHPVGEVAVPSQLIFIRGVDELGEKLIRGHEGPGRSTPAGTGFRDTQRAVSRAGSSRVPRRRGRRGLITTEPERFAVGVGVCRHVHEAHMGGVIGRLLAARCQGEESVGALAGVQRVLGQHNAKEAGRHHGFASPA